MTRRYERGKRSAGAKWVIAMGVVAVAAGGWILWTATGMASRKREGVVRQLSPAAAEGASGSAAAGTAPEREAPTRSEASRPDPSKVDQIIEAAAVWLKRDDPGRAGAIYKEAVSQYAGEPRLHTAYGDLLVVQRRFDEAYGQYTRALAAGEKNAPLEFTAGTVASMMGKPERAAEHYAAAQAIEPSNAEYALFLGQTQAKLGRLDEAKVSLLRVVKIDPKRAIAWGTLGDIALRENNVAIALQHVGKAREIEPDAVVWRIVEARALNRSGEPQKALDLLVGLSDADKNQPATARLIAECLGMLGRKDEAARWSARAEGPEGGR